MKKHLILLVLLAGIPFLLQAGVLRTKHADLVNPFIGTDFHGHTFPGAAYPFGMIQLSPDTREHNWDGCSGYHYSDTTINGFSHTHLSGTGCADLCDIRVMPVTGFTEPGPEESYRSAFSHDRETASAGYYSVHLDRWNVDAELTVGRRIGVHRYTFPEGSVPQLMLDLVPRDKLLGTKITQVGDYAIQGFRRSEWWADDQIVYFYMEFSRPISDMVIEQGTGENQDGIRALLSFAERSGGSRSRELIVRVGISSVSETNARANLESENIWLKKGIFSFDLLRESTRHAWEKFLSKIDVEGDRETMQIFYTALYHTAIAPSLYSDANGEYRGMDRKVHKTDGWDRYHIFSLWDTYRTLHPLFNIIERERTVDFIKSMLSIYEEQGKLPRWELSANETDCMIGYSAAPMIADAVVKGIRGFDLNKALEALVATANYPEYGIDVYRDNGLVLGDKVHEDVSRTLEYAVDDWCIAQVARIAGDRHVESQFLTRSQYWRNVYDPSTGFMRPRVNGMWLDPFDPTEVNNHYTEANSWQYSFHVQHDVSGLVAVSGGDDSMEQWLDELFTTSSQTAGRDQADMTGMIGQYVQGNEPSHHIAYLYDYIGVPWKTQRMVRRIMDELFTAQPDGLCGNEDCGQMSAWYVMSALGFFPVTPGSDQFALGSPVFRNAVIHLENGKDFTVRAPRTSATHRYVNHIMRDGKPYTKAYIRFADIEEGHTFIFGMDETPNVNFGTQPSQRPVSAVEQTIVVNPWFKVPSATFNAFTKVEIEAADKDYRIWYQMVPEGSPAGGDFERYERPFTVSRSCTIYAYCTDVQGNRSFTMQTTLRRVDNSYKVQLTHPSEQMYTGGGDNAIVDGIRGQKNFRLGGWQGFQDSDFEAVIDLGQVKHLAGLSAGFLQDTGAWIVLPVWVEYATSLDGREYQQQGHLTHEVAPDDYTVQIHEFSLPLDTDARYVKVLARNYGILPDWHDGAGGRAHIFVDEVSIL
ncbi:MAG: GH92 family glycosyl hydrolase [Bacteroidales bacterium]|nr:GH92 family glycosyl hydrolase [Bacteroidales bacterium]